MSSARQRPERQGGSHDHGSYPARNPLHKPQIARRGGQILGTTALWLVCFFGAAGTLVWPRAWLYAALCVLMLLANLFVVPRNPTVVAERSRSHRGTGPLDQVFGSIFGLLLLATPTIAGLVSLVGRTVLEDRTLRAERSGHAQYAQQTRHRPLPGLW